MCNIIYMQRYFVLLNRSDITRLKDEYLYCENTLYGQKYWAICI